MVKAAVAQDRITCTTSAAHASFSGTTSEIIKSAPDTFIMEQMMATISIERIGIENGQRMRLVLSEDVET